MVINDSDDSSNSSDSAPRPIRQSRVARKSTAQAPPLPPPQPLPQPITRRQAAMANREKEKEKTNRFLQNFNPDNSLRERRKLEKKIQNRKLTGCINDHDGVHIGSGKDMCDCLEIICPGCFFPCKKCGSSKCGVECRAYRKNRYESIEYHGYNVIKRNPLEIL